MKFSTKLLIANCVPIIVFAIISLIILIVIGFINQLSDPVGSILLGIFSVYFVFFYNRAVGLLYSDA